ncbi:MAG: hypothetical protein IJ173_08945, partial [Kiritimatiellae bacterium]|nr:hypothetical protein [Kiritimatiellia bacterium]
MRFVSPVLLVLAAAVPFAGLFWSFLKARREKALTRLTLNVPATPFAGVQTACLLAGLVLVLFAAARPQWGQTLEKHVARSRNVVVAIDVSRSMLAAD